MILMYGTLPHHMVIKQDILYVSLLMNWSLNIKTFLYNDKWPLLQTVTYPLHRGYFDAIMKVTITPDYITMYQSPFSSNEIKYFMSLMQNDTKATGKGATYAKLEVLLSKQNER